MNFLKKKLPKEYEDTQDMKDALSAMKKYEDQYELQREYLLSQQRLINEKEKAERLAETKRQYELAQRRAQALPAPNPFVNKSTQSYPPSGGGGYGVYSDSHVRSVVDVGSMIKEAVDEASKEFKLTVESMQEQIDELWEVIRELEDD